VIFAAQATILVVDDDDGFRSLLGDLLERAAFAVEEARDGAEALAAAERRPPSLVLLDVRLPDVSGYEVFRELRDRLGDHVPVIFVSGERTETYDRVAGLLLGADDYIVKPIDPDELVARVRCSLRLARNRTPPGTNETARDARFESLTPRELEILMLLADGLSSPDIAAELVISRRTVGTHVQHILAKLDVHTRTQAVAAAHRAGLTAEVTGHLLAGVARPAA
jgi:DNA-binding NarL/FixJ family response regulator